MMPAPPSPIPTATATPIPLPTPDGARRTLQVPVLMYHYVSSAPEGADTVRRDLSVTPDQFEEHLLFLQQAGYTSISLHDLALALQTGYRLPEKPLVITLDDGYRDNYEVAFPLLQRYDFTATFFLLTSVIDQEHPGYVSWEQVIEMGAAGMEMGAHGYTHVDMRERTVDYLVWQMLGSKEAIEARIGEPVRFFCYPSGKYDEQAMRVLHSADYWGAVTVELGDTQRSDGMFELPRVRVHGRYTALDLANVLDWVSSQGAQAP
jgi:peptidoglycan/xylan/chitin deacetylase (PgdA/CDA1 family)